MVGAARGFLGVGGAGRGGTPIKEILQQLKHPSTHTHTQGDVDGSSQPRPSENSGQRKPSRTHLHLHKLKTPAHKATLSILQELTQAERSRVNT